MKQKSVEGIPLYTIKIAAKLIGTNSQTLRIYEKHGLIKPTRRNNNRFYSDNDIKWLLCLRELIHDKKISIEGIKKLLDYAPCWEIKDCPEEVRNKCLAYIDRVKPCWEYNQMACRSELGRRCEDCIIFLSKMVHKGKNRPKNE